MKGVVVVNIILVFNMMNDLIIVIIYGVNFGNYFYNELIMYNYMEIMILIMMMLLMKNLISEIIRIYFIMELSLIGIRV